MTSKASSQDTAVNSPFLSYLPALFRNIGWVRRSWPYMILERKYPFTQLSPRLTSDLMSPWVATTRFSLVATMTLQPVPQKRHGALSHFSSLASRSVMRFAARAGAGIPPARAAIAAAFNLRTWRRSGCDGVIWRFFPGGVPRRVKGVKDERGGVDVGEEGEFVERGSDDPRLWRVDDDHKLALRITGVDLAA